MVFTEVSVAMMCEDPEEHKLIRKGKTNHMIANFNKKVEDKKMITKRVFPLVSVQVRHEEPGNYTHLILFPRNYSLIAKSGTSLIIWRSGILHFIC